MSLAELELFVGQSVEILTPTGFPTRRIGQITAVLPGELFHVVEEGRQRVEVLPRNRVRAVWTADELSFPEQVFADQNLGNNTGFAAAGGGGSSDLDGLLLAHLVDFANPHRVSKGQIGLGNVDNTSDAAKPLSNAAVLALAGKQTQNQNLTDISALTVQMFGLGLLEQGTAGDVRSYIGAGTSSFDGVYSSLTGIPATFTPSAHSHGNISNTGTIGSTANLPLITTTGGTVTTGSFGSAANTFCQGNDSRLSNAREWTAATVTQAEAEAGVATSRMAFTVQRVWQAINAWWNGSAAKTKLDGIENNATANSSDAFLLARANHTGTQAWSTIVSTPTTLAGYGITDGQPLDSDLTAIAALTTQAFGRGILEQTSAANVRSYIGAGTSSFDGAYSSLTGVPATFTPSAHTHGNISNTGAIGSTANLPLITGASGVLQVGAFGTTANTFCQGNDARLSDARTPLAHTHAASDITSGTLDVARIPNLDANKITSGTISIDRLPQGALERLVIVEDQAARFALTTVQVQNGDTVKQVDTGIMYFVVDDTQLSSEAGYSVYTAGAASVVPWAGITDKPLTFPPDAHSHGNISNTGTIGSTANLPLITTTGGTVTTGAFGTTANTFCVGNDSRLSDARTPTSHTHGNITNVGAIGATANLPIITGDSGVLQAGSFGSAANTFCQGNDPRLSDARTPLAHTHGNITNAGAIGAVANLPLITTTGGVVTTGTFGNTANTFTQGNDSRLSDSREWVAETVEQVEAEEGTATTRRAWTAQRVRQAIEAWANVGPLELLRPVVLTQPEPASAVVGEALAISCLGGILPNTHLNLGYQWEFDNGSSYTDVPSAGGPVLTIPFASAGNTGLYRCRLENEFGVEYTDPVNITVDGSITHLFPTTAERGVAWDLDRMDHLWQSQDGRTPVTYGDPVGLVVTTERGGLDALGPELIADPSAVVTLFRDNVNPQLSFATGITLEVGKTYRIQFDLIRNEGTVGFGIATTSNTFAQGQQIISGLTPLGQVTRYATVLTQTFTVSFLPSNAVCDMDITNISIREVPGDHLRQATSARRPTYARRPKSGVRQLLINSGFLGAISGTPGTPPTSWTNFATGATMVADGDSLTFSATVDRRVITSNAITVPANTNYTASIVVEVVSGPINANQLLALSTSLGTRQYKLNGNDILGSNGVPVGIHVLELVASHTDSFSAGTRIGVGVSSNSTGEARITQPQIEIGSARSQYQLSGLTQFDITEEGQPSINYLWFDGIDDSLVTAAALDLTSSDELTASLAVRKLSDAGGSVYVESSSFWNTNDGSFNLQKNSNVPQIQVGSRGTISVTSGGLSVPADEAQLLLTLESKISADLLRLRNLQGAWQGSSENQGTGNYGNYVVCIGARNQVSAFANIHLYSGFILNKTLDPLILADFEKYWVGSKAGIDLP